MHFKIMTTLQLCNTEIHQREFISVVWKEVSNSYKDTYKAGKIITIHIVIRKYHNYVDIIMEILSVWSI